MPREKKTTPARKKTTLKAVPKPAEPVQTVKLVDDPNAPLGYHILAAARSYTNALQAALSAKTSTSKLTVPRLQAMQLVAANDGITGAEIARALNVKPQTVTTIIASLSSYGWIERNGGRGRAIRTHLTPLGRAQMNKGVATLVKIDEALANSYSYDGAEAVTLTDLLCLGRQTFTSSQAA